MKDYLILTMDNCSYCDKAKAEFDKRSKSYATVNIMDVPELSAVLTGVGRSTFPLVLKVVGGHAELLNHED